jgi:hypothetical protein
MLVAAGPHAASVKTTGIASTIGITSARCAGNRLPGTAMKMTSIAPLIVTHCTPAVPVRYHPPMDRVRPSSRMLLVVGIIAFLVHVPQHVDASGRKSAGRKGANQATKKPVVVPEASPLDHAWPTKESPQLGDGTRRSELLVAARRVVGLKNSFDEDGFLRHLAYVLDLARKQDSPDNAWVRTFVHRAIEHGDLKKDLKARPGDLVVFSLDTARPGSAKASRLVVGVVESVSKGLLRFIAPIGDTVVRGIARPGKKAIRDDTAIVSCGARELANAEVAQAPSGKRSKKTPRKPRALPCRAGEMWVGRVAADSLDRLF